MTLAASGGTPSRRHAAAMARPITPYPVPRSSTCPGAGGCVSRGEHGRTDVQPAAAVQTPEPLTRSSRWPHTSQLNGSRANGTDGSAEK